MNWELLGFLIFWGFVCAIIGAIIMLFIVEPLYFRHCRLEELVKGVEK